jgi:hypothetical protein
VIRAVHNNNLGNGALWGVSCPYMRKAILVGSVVPRALSKYLTAVALVTLALMQSSLPQESIKKESGSLTIFTVPKTWSKYIGPGLDCEPSKLSIRIDDGDTVQWPRTKRIAVRDLALDKSHLVTARCAGKPLQAVRFRFSNYKSTHVCVSYDAYGGIYLFDYTTRGWGCKQTSNATDPD